MEEDEDLHNKMKYDLMISDEQITADNAKISTLETNISAKSASVAQLTDESDMLENDSKQVQVFRCDRASQQSTTEDIDHNSKRRSYCSKEHQTYFHGLLQSKNMQLSHATTTREKQLTEYREANKSKTEDIESSSEASAELCATTTQIDVLIAPKNTHIMMLNRTMKVSCECVPLQKVQNCST